MKEEILSYEEAVLKKMKEFDASSLDGTGYYSGFMKGFSVVREILEEESLMEEPCGTSCSVNI